MNQADLYADQDPEMTRQIREAMAPISSLRARLLLLADDGRGGGPAPGSVASLEAQHPMGGRTWQFALLSLNAAIDHLLAWSELHHRGIQPSFAHMTLLRTAMETSAMCRWLIDPEQSSEERLKRGVGAELADHEARAGAERDLGRTEGAGPAKTATARKLELLADMSRLSLGKQKPPNVTELMARYGPRRTPASNRALYRILSAHAHGLRWASLLSSISNRRDSLAVASHMTVRLSANDSQALYVTMYTVGLFNIALTELEAYAGRLALPRA